MTINMIIDSGAFSAWKLGKPVNIENYCAYLERNLDWISHYVALDVISPGRPEEAAAASFENLEYMLARGLNPIPVFHVGEDLKWLRRMIDAGCDYIGLSASSLMSRNKVDDWYSYVWSHLVNRDGYPIVKAHAFGEGRLSSLRQFPWYSADSTSWIYTAMRAGHISMPGGGRVAMRNDKLSLAAAPDLGSLSEIERAAFDAMLDKAGVSKASLLVSNNVSTIIRTYITGLCYVEYQREIRALHPIRRPVEGFFGGGFKPRAPAASFDKFNMHLVCGLHTGQYALIAKLGHPSVLTSYFYIETPNTALAAGHSYGLKNLREFCDDPRGFVQRENIWNKYWKILEEFVQ